MCKTLLKIGVVLVGVLACEKLYTKGYEDGYSNGVDDGITVATAVSKKLKENDEKSE